ncbi:MAG: hypothetical protein DRJ03_13520 [Chloroflexi bacterium]|nr:MAG: hypothetical protein B6I35_12695 [Anaerolineaceae bacterium 4572_32.2]RLC78393.1 MAG: hypothetical protein DRI81_06740 [Chloroflexota bacterium]RLC84696.1 MAG: hypothetical protein DRJ03_13520 [Chloroflexota bacterium]HEY73850.1 hypothetical protein [Thermoflexia bacterium]
MKIGQQQPKRPSVQSLGWISALLLVFVIGLLAGGQEWDAALDVVLSIPLRITQSITPATDLPTLIVDMSFSSYNDILGQREQALQDGVYIPSNQGFVTATIKSVGAATVQSEGVAVPVRMRLLEGPADHLDDDEKWGFEVRTRQNRQLLGMQRFYLSDPAVNNWLNEWAFAHDLEREGILAARYQFVHLIFNGDDWGIYALQEGFADELLMAQRRQEGVIVRCDADLLWESIAHFQGDAQAAYADPIANLSTGDWQYFEVDAFRDAAIDSDPALSAQRDAAIGLLRALQAGELEASRVFDVERYGRFLALVDLWGATPAASLVNLHYYYNPVSGRLEPIGFNGNALGSDSRVSLTAAYDDPAIQAAYVREAWRVSQPEYLDQLQSELEEEYESLRQAVGVGEPPWDKLRARQEQMARSLSPVQPVFAHLGSPTLTMSGTIRVAVANVLNLPVEIVGFDIGGATFLPANRAWLQDGAAELLLDDTGSVTLRALDAERVPVLRYVYFDLPLVEIHRLDNELDFMQEVDIQVVTQIPGLSNTHLTLARQGYPDILAAEATE